MIKACAHSCFSSITTSLIGPPPVSLVFSNSSFNNIAGVSEVTPANRIVFFCGSHNSTVKVASRKLNGPFVTTLLATSNNHTKINSIYKFNINITVKLIFSWPKWLLKQITTNKVFPCFNHFDINSIGVYET